MKALCVVPLRDHGVRVWDHHPALPRIAGPCDPWIAARFLAE
jgi:hypothetical protein